MLKDILSLQYSDDRDEAFAELGSSVLLAESSKGNNDELQVVEISEVLLEVLRQIILGIAETSDHYRWFDIFTRQLH